MGIHIFINPAGEEDQNVTPVHSLGSLNFGPKQKIPSITAKKNSAAMSTTPLFRPGPTLTPKQLKSMQGMKAKARSAAIAKLGEVQT